MTDEKKKTKWELWQEEYKARRAVFESSPPETALIKDWIEVSGWELSVRTFHCLQNLIGETMKGKAQRWEITAPDDTIACLARIPVAHMLRIRCLGSKTLHEISQGLWDTYPQLRDLELVQYCQRGQKEEKA